MSTNKACDTCKYKILQFFTVQGDCFQKSHLNRKYFFFFVTLQNFCLCAHPRIQTAFFILLQTCLSAESVNGEAPPHACSVSLTNGASKRMVSGITGRAVAGVGHTCGDEESEVQHIACRAYRVRSMETQGLRQMAQLWTCEPRKQPGLLLLSVENVTAWELRCSKYRNQKKPRQKSSL